MYVHPQTHEEISTSGYNYLAIVFASDLTDTVDGEAQTLPLFSLPVGSQIRHVALELPEKFQNTGEVGNDDTTVQVGDSNDHDSLITATQINYNSGSPATFPIYDTGTLPEKVGSYPSIVAEFTPKSATKLSELNKGVLLIFFDIFVPTTGMGN